MKNTLLILCLSLSGHSFSQSFTLADFDSIVAKQNIQSGLSGNAYRFVKEKIEVASFYGSEDKAGTFHMKGETFKNSHTREILWIEIRETNAAKKMIGCTMGYTAPDTVIHKMEKELGQNGYRYKKRKKYYIKRKNRKEYIIAQKKKNSAYVSEFDSQPELLFTAYKKLKSP